ncbi:MAG: polyprenol monophosphomannose synthase [Candidatus Dormibacteraeota bacterium]|nr:polyprenol monophosphomannose synthase [Candidatus Dormibacteraeota bacterium]
MSAGRKVLVVVPTYNERENLERAVLGIRGCGYDVLVVDDSSPDGTAELARELGERDIGIMLLQRPGKLGLGSAYVAGFRFGLERGYDLFVEMDADGSHRPEHLPQIVEAAAENGGLGIGSRYVPGGSVVGWGWHRRLLSSGANLYCRMVLGLGVRDCTAGYRCYTRALLSAIDLDRVFSQGYSFQVEMLYRCVKLGFPVTEVPIRFEDRVAGQSKVSQGEVSKALLAVLRLRLRLRKDRSGAEVR